MHAAYREVGSYRAAAEICGTTPKTVKRSVLAAQAAEQGEIPVVEHNYDAVRDVVIERVERTKGKMSAKRLLPVARAAGYTGSARNFRRLVAEVKAQWRAQATPGSTPGHLDTGRHVGLRLGRDRTPIRLLRRDGLEPGPLRVLRRQPRCRLHHDGTGSVLRVSRRCPQDGVDRPHGLP